MIDYKYQVKFLILRSVSKCDFLQFILQLFRTTKPMVPTAQAVGILRLSISGQIKFENFRRLSNID